MHIFKVCKRVLVHELVFPGMFLNADFRENATKISIPKMVFMAP
jgi:hypothetical protein